MSECQNAFGYSDITKPKFSIFYKSPVLKIFQVSWKICTFKYLLHRLICNYERSDASFQLSKELHVNFCLVSQHVVKLFKTIKHSILGTILLQDDDLYEIEVFEIAIVCSGPTIKVFSFPCKLKMWLSRLQIQNTVWF